MKKCAECANYKPCGPTFPQGGFCWALQRPMQNKSLDLVIEASKMRFGERECSLPAKYRQYAGEAGYQGDSK